MKQLLKLLLRFKILLLLLVLGSCGFVAKRYINITKIEEMTEENIKQNRFPDSSLSQMSIEEFQAIAQKYFGNTRLRVEPFYYVGKHQAGTIMKTEGTLYYVQSFSARGVVYDVGGVPVSADLKIGIGVAGEAYFLSDATYYLIINDFVCDEMSVQDLVWSGGGAKTDENAIYAVGWKAVLY